MSTETTPTDLREGLLMQTPKHEVVQVSTIYDTRVTAEIVYPKPGRTAVRTFTLDEVALWRPVTDAMFARYEIAWGFR